MLGKRVVDRRWPSSFALSFAGAGKGRKPTPAGQSNPRSAGVGRQSQFRLSAAGVELPSAGIGRHHRDRASEVRGRQAKTDARQSRARGGPRFPDYVEPQPPTKAQPPLAKDSIEPPLPDEPGGNLDKQKSFK